MADELFQKRAYELAEYIQLILGDVGYEDPSSVWIAVDRAGWPKAMKMSLIQFIDAISSQSEYYLNNGAPWVDQAAVLAGFPFASRNQYDTVNIMGVEYWFQADKTTLVNKFGSIVLTDGSVTLAKQANVASGTIFYRKTAGAGPPEIQTLAQLKTDLQIPAQTEVARQNVFKIKFPTGDVATRCAGVLDIPVNWTVAAGANPNDLVVTHNLNREIADAKVWAIEPAGKTLLYANMAYSGVVAPTADSLTIRNFATIDFQVTLHLIFE